MSVVGLAVHYLFPRYKAPPNTLLVSPSTKFKFGWWEGLALVSYCASRIAQEVIDIPYLTGREKYYRQNLTPLDILLAVIEFAALCVFLVRGYQFQQREQVVLTTTELIFVKHGRVVTTGMLTRLVGVSPIRRNVQEDIQYWLALFDQGASIRIYPKRENGKAIVNQLYAMLPRAHP